MATVSLGSSEASVPPVERPTATTSATEHEARDIPRRVGDYEILEVAGRGGMGVVFKARQLRLNRIVALKMIAGGSFSNSHQHRRFAAEVEACAQLHHPNIVAVHEAGEHEGLPYFAMEWVSGQTLAGLVRDRPIESRRAAAYLSTIARAIHHAHESGIAHRDLKPSNILIDEEDRPRVTDFGLARHLNRESELTVSGQTLGTPGYLPPEHIGGSPDRHGPAGDVYALGAILYYLLTGRAPFVAENIQTALLHILEADPVSPRRLNPEVPLDLETICLKCLAKKPDGRFATAKELAEELDRFLRNEPILSRPIGQLTRITRWVGRNPMMAMLSGLLVAALVSGFIATTRQWQRAEANATGLSRSVTELKLERAESFLASDATPQGLAALAEIVRKDPTHSVAAQRIVSALSQRRFLHPLPGVVTNDSVGGGSAFAGHGNLLATSEDGGRTLVLWDTKNGFQLQHRVEIGEPVLAAAFSRDGELLVVATTGRNLHVIDVQLGRRSAGPYPLNGFARTLTVAPGSNFVVITLVPDLASTDYRQIRGVVLRFSDAHRIHEKIPFHEATFSPNRRLVATIDFKTVILRDAASWEPTGVQVHDRARINSATFSADSKQLVTAGADFNATIWDLATGESILRIPHPVNVLTAFLIAEGERLFTMDTANNGRLWDAKTGQMLGRPFRSELKITPESFPADGSLVICSGASGISLRDGATGEMRVSTFASEETLLAARFINGGFRFLTTSVLGTTRQWAIKGHLTQPMIFPEKLELNHASLSPDGSQVAVSVRGSWARLWDASDGQAIDPALRHRREVWKVSWSPDGERIAFASPHSSTQIWDAKTRRKIGDPMRHEAPIEDVEFSADGRWIATASQDGTARIWNGANGTPGSQPLQHQARVDHAHFDPHSSKLVSVSRDGTARLWSVPEGTPIGIPFQGKPWFSDAIFDPSGRRLLTAEPAGGARLWDLDTGRELIPPMLHPGNIRSIAFDASGTRIVTASEDGAARIWETATGKLLGPPLRHLAAVHWAGFSPDERFVFSVSADATARIWDARSGHPVSDPFRHEQQIVAGEWAKNGNRILTASYDRTARLWPVYFWPDAPAPGWLADLAESVGGLRLTDSGVMTNLPVSEVVATRAKLAAMAKPGPSGDWLRAFLSERPFTPDFVPPPPLDP